MLALANDERRLALFTRIWSICAVLLLFSTWKLWTPTRGFPQIPAAAMFGKLPTWVDWLTLGAMVASLLLTALTTANSRFKSLGLFTFAVSLLLAFSINQHRFQPWAYQFMAIAVVLATSNAPAAIRLLRWLTIGIYFWSAWSKCDFTFAHHLGQQLLKALLGWSGFETWPPKVQLLLAASVPLVELLIAAGLYFRRSRAVFVWLSVLFHALLLVALGPLGLHHKPGVLLWNAYFIVQNVVLFSRAEGEAASATAVPARWPFAKCLIGAVLLWPLFEHGGFCDHWPAWSVYAPRVERIAMLVHLSELERLPKYLQKRIEPSVDDDRWGQLRLDRWSLEVLDVPLYPQNRFQIGVAEAVARRFGLTQSRVVALSDADRRSGERVSQVYTGLGQIERATSRYFLGARSVRDWNPH